MKLLIILLLLIIVVILADISYWIKETLCQLKAIKAYISTQPIPTRIENGGAIDPLSFYIHYSDEELRKTK